MQGQPAVLTSQPTRSLSMYDASTIMFGLDYVWIGLHHAEHAAECPAGPSRLQDNSTLRTVRKRLRLKYEQPYNDERCLLPWKRPPWDLPL